MEIRSKVIQRPRLPSLLQGDLPAGIKSGYTFNIVNCSKVTVNNTDQITSFEVQAVPQAIGKTGNRGFCIDQFNELKADPQGWNELHPNAAVKFSQSENKSSRQVRWSRAILTSLMLFSLCVLTGGTSASGAQGMASNQPSAADLARIVDEHYNRLRSLKTGFSEYYAGLGMQRSESGTMLLRKPGKMRWEYTSTQGKVFVLDGKYAWFYSPGDTQVQRIAAGQLDDLRSPLRFLLGHTKIESEIEHLTIASDKAGQYVLAGVPKGQRKRISRLSLTVNASGVIEGIAIEETDGARTSFAFTNEEPNAVIPESAFHFTPPVGVPVVDALPPV